MTARDAQRSGPGRSTTPSSELTMTAYERRIRAGSEPTALTAVWDTAAIDGCWFELQRAGGCGAGVVRLDAAAVSIEAIPLGTWVSLEATAGERWYLGRVVRRARSEAGLLTLQLAGAGALLDDIRPGGLDADRDQRPPWRFGDDALSSHDPDAAEELSFAAESPIEALQALLAAAVVGSTPMVCPPERIEASPFWGGFGEAKFRGESRLSAIVADWALRARAESWGVDEQLEFFCLQPRTTVQATFRAGREVLSLSEAATAAAPSQRLLIVGGVREATFDGLADSRGPTHFRAVYWAESSIGSPMERTVSVHVPWLRTARDARRFARELLRRTAADPRELTWQTVINGPLPRPWTGAVELQNADGSLWYRGPIDVVRVSFDAVPLATWVVEPFDAARWWPLVAGQATVPFTTLRDAAGELFDDSPGGPISLVDPAVITGCPGCGAGLPTRWRVTLTGLTAGGCSTCATLVGAYTLEWLDLIDGTCIWETNLGHCDDTGPIRLRIEWGSTQTLLIATTVDNELAGYAISAAERTCHGANVLTLGAANGLCLGWPATLTIAPADE